ncbi:MAG: amino acid-binding protein [Phocaeicola sp.]
MKIQQLSIFLENKHGRINEVTKILAKENIDMQAFSMAETAEFGILRLIVSDVKKAVDALHTANFAVKLTEVVSVECPNVTGYLSEILDYLAKENLFIEYMYAFAQSDVARVVIRPTNIDRCVELFEKYQKQHKELKF